MIRRTKHQTHLADLGLLYVAAIWGSTFFVVKDSLAYVDPVMLVGYRFGLATLIMGGYLLYRRKSWWIDFKAGGTLGVLLWLCYVPQTIGLEFTTASNSGFITGLFVAFVPLFTLLFFRELPSPAQLLTILISMLGLWFLTGGLAQINAGDLLTVITAMAFALHILTVDRYARHKLDPYILSFQQFLTVGLLSIIVGLLFGLPVTVASPGTLGIILFLTLFPTLSAFVIQLIAQKYMTPVKVSLILAVEPIFAALFAWTLGGETFVPGRAAGGMLVVAAIILAELPIPPWRLARAAGQV